MRIPHMKKMEVQMENGQEESKQRLAYRFCKRFMDIVLATIGIVFSLPFILVFGILIKWESKGPCFYRQERVGKGGTCFILYKLRSMHMDAEKEGPQWAQQDDPRVTKVGKFMRKTRIDEIPQLINILKGDMSVVGPRPERPYFMSKFGEEIPRYSSRLQVKPGLTGLAQVNGGYELTPQEKLEKDLYYIYNQSLWLDIKIILRTMKIVVTGKGAR